MSTGVQAVLLGILGFCTNFEWFLGTCMIQRPIVIGPFCRTHYGRLPGRNYHGSNDGIGICRRGIDRGI